MQHLDWGRSLQRNLTVDQSTTLHVRYDMTADAAAIENTLNANRALAQSLGINGTPAFVIDDTLVPGAMPYEQLANSVKTVRDNGGCKLC